MVSEGGPWYPLNTSMHAEEVCLTSLKRVELFTVINKNSTNQSTLIKIFSLWPKTV